MANGVTGDFAKLQRFAKKFGNLSGQNALTAINSAMADATIELIDQGFEEEREPSGRPWRDKVFPNGKPVLEGDGDLRKSFKKKQVTSRTFVVASDDPKFKFHQGGTGLFGPKKRRIRPKAGGALAWKVGARTYFASSVAGAPKRKMLPDAKRNPASWNKRQVKAAERRMLEIFNR